jgi:hypothetical protein
MEEYINKKELIAWLEGMKYNIDITSPTMTEDFEREHRWELSRNYILDKTINHIVKLESLG